MKNWRKLVDKKYAGKFLFILALAGMALIFFSTLDVKKEETASDEEPETDYSQQLEQKLSAVVSKITGEKSVEVFVTLENGQETIYADLVDESNDRTEDTDGKSSQKTQEKSDTKHSVILVEDKDGAQKALVVTTMAPTVRGVVIVSEYASNEAIRESIVTAVTTALNISSKKVCVVGVYEHETQ